MMENTALNNTKIEIPKTVSDYLYYKHLATANGYKRPNGKAESCSCVASEIAKLLFEAGYKPYILAISESVYENGLIHPKELVPLIYQGKVIWYAHIICCCDGQVFDPILEAPISIKDYGKAVFGEDVKMQTLVPCDKIEKFVNQ